MRLALEILGGKEGGRREKTGGGRRQRASVCNTALPDEGEITHGTDTQQHDQPIEYGPSRLWFDDDCQEVHKRQAEVRYHGEYRWVYKQSWPQTDSYSKRGIKRKRVQFKTPHAKRRSRTKLCGEAICREPCSSKQCRMKFVAHCMKLSRW